MVWRSGFDFGDVVEEVIDRTVGESSTAEDVTSIRRSIHLVMEEWHAAGYNTWRVKHRDFSFGATEGQVALPSEIDDILQANIVLSYGVDGAARETPLSRMSETQYAQLNTKSTQGVPTQYVLYRSEPPSLAVFPVGRQGQTETLRITYVARPAAFDRFDNDSDIPSRWLRALIFGVSADFASKRPRRVHPRVAERLDAQYAEARELALRNDGQRVGWKMRMG